MSLNTSIRVVIKIFLAIQLLLLIFRQLIDFAGIQWLMIVINAVAIIITITAFFGHLRLYGFFQVFLILYNIFVILVYGRFLTVSGGPSEDFVSSTDNSIQSLSSNHKTFYHSDFPTTTRTSTLPSTQLLSFDPNSRSFWYVIVSNHVSELHATIVSSPVLPNTFPASTNSADAADRRHQPSFVDESLVDLCVQYIEIAIASLHIFFSLLGIGLILLKNKLERDKLFRNNDKTTPPLPPYTISPQMNHYMSYTPTHPFNQASSTKGSIYNTNNSSSSMRRSKRHRRSTRSLHNSKSKANSMGALNLRTSTGSLRSMSKQQHRKSATSLLNDTSYSNNTMGSRGGGTMGRGSKGAYQQMLPPPPPPLPTHNGGGGYGTSRSSGYGVISHSGGSSSQQHAAKFLTSDSETDYYHTFTPNYVNNGLNNPLYGNRHSYLNDSETAI